MSAGSPQIVAAFGTTRTISLYHIHTKETLTVTYKQDGEYIPDALKQINWLMRDWRENEQTEIDPKTIDLLWEMHTELGSKEPIHIICGYRSPKTNNMLRRTVGGQAKGSFHINGKAVDATFPDISLKQMRYSALIRERGGVGYYPTSGIPFVHVDSGPVRAWPRLPRYELALLFPNGKTKHNPASGGSITPDDVRVARTRHKELADQVTAYFDVRNNPKAPVELAEADAPRLQAPAPLPAHRPETRVASLGPLTAPELESSPKLLREATYLTPPPEAERGRLNELVSLASLTPEPAYRRPPEADRNKLARLLAASVDAPMALGAPPARATEPSVPRLAALEPEAAAARRPAAAPDTGWSNGFAPQPDFDDDHPEELSYRPFPVAPFLTQTASPDDEALVKIVHPDVARTLELLNERQVVLPLRLRPGRQAAEVMWAQQFRGGAVDISVLDAPEPEQSAPSKLASHPVRTTSR